jgi:hypothetical protein
MSKYSNADYALVVQMLLGDGAFTPRSVLQGSRTPLAAAQPKLRVAVRLIGC